MTFKHPDTDEAFRTIARAVLDYPNATDDQIAGAVDTLLDSPDMIDRDLATLFLQQRWPTDEQRTADAHNLPMLAGMNAAQIRYDNARIWRLCAVVAIIAAVAVVGAGQLISIAVDRALNADIEVLK